MYVCIINLGKARAKKCLSNKFIVLSCRYSKAGQSKDKKPQIKARRKARARKSSNEFIGCAARVPRPLAPSILVTFNPNRHVINHVIDHMKINYLLLLHPGRSTAVTTSSHFHSCNLFLLGIVIYFNQSSQYKLSYSSITWCSRLNSGGADEHEPIIRLTLQPPTTYPRILKPSHYISNPKSNSIHYKSTQQ